MLRYTNRIARGNARVHSIVRGMSDQLRSNIFHTLKSDATDYSIMEIQMLPGK